MLGVYGLYATGSAFEDSHDHGNMYWSSVFYYAG